MAKAVDEYKVAVADLDKAINRKDANKAKKALDVTTSSLSTYAWRSACNCSRSTYNFACATVTFPVRTPRLIFNTHSHAGLRRYRTLAQIDKEDGGIIRLPEGNPEEAGHAGAPLGYVVPAFRGGGTKNDFALR
eukprot:761999-Pleurochrysis_carterae.AAC.3